MFKNFKNKNPFAKALWGLVIVLVAVSLFITVKNVIKINQPGYYAGKIFGKKITTEEFKDTYKRLSAITHFQYGEMFKSLEPLIDMDQRTWETLMLLKDAQKKNISASNKDIISEISSYKFFYRGKHFDALLYKNIIRNSLNIEPREFEEGIRDLIIKRKLQEKITSSVSVSKDDILNEYKDRYETMQLSYVEVPMENYKKNVSVTDEEIQKYYSEHNKDLLRPRSINVEYIKLDFPEEGGIQKQVEMKYKAKAIIDEYAKTKDLKESAGKLKFEVKESGFFSKEEPNSDIGLDFPSIMNLFKTEKGKVLEPFKTEKGYIVVKIKDKKNPFIPSVNEATDTIKKIVIEKKARLLALEQAKKDYDQIMSKWKQLNDADKSFTNIAKKLGFDVKQTPSQSIIQTADSLGLTDEFENNKSVLYALSEKDPISKPTLTMNGAGIFHLDSLEPFDEEQFKKDKDEFAKNLLERKKEKVFSEYIDKLEEKANLIYF